MKQVLFSLIGLVLLAQTSFSQRQVLVEVFTNSHCGLCPTAYTAIHSYQSNPQNEDKIIPIFYHMSFPYSSDQLNQENPQDAANRNTYYGPFTSTPRAFFDGALNSNAYSNWSNTLNGLAAESPLASVSNSVTVVGDSLLIETTYTKFGALDENDIRLHVLILEDVNYRGNNGISDHENVVREMIGGSTGTGVTVTDNIKTLMSASKVRSIWEIQNLKVISFLQSQSKKTIYAVEIVPYSSFGTSTSVKNIDLGVTEFELLGNYPNPFNPTTTIKFMLPEAANVAVKIYNIVGQELATLVNGPLNAGVQEINFDGKNFASGLYLYRVTVDGQSFTRTMTLNK